MKNYETIIAFASSLDDTTFRSRCEKIKAQIEGFGGVSVEVDVWGKRELAYSIDKNRFGHFANFVYKSDKSNIVRDLEASLNLSEDVLRYQTHYESGRQRKFRGSLSGNKGMDLESHEYSY
ncbi:MAG: 30S ribosomal protein S6 [Bdellovibrionales bacterium]|nr:30S ribosomal protein S6 [Bdellovibrionales bacterium]